MRNLYWKLKILHKKNERGFKMTTKKEEVKSLLTKLEELLENDKVSEFIKNDTLYRVDGSNDINYIKQQIAYVERVINREK